MRLELRDQMKEQTIGVEIEMNEITREDAAKVAAKYFGTVGINHVGGGYDKYVAYDQSGREWVFCYDSSITGDWEHKCELNTPILHYDDIETLQGLVRELRNAGAKSNARRGCGVHVHVGADGHTPNSLRVLANVMASHESLLIRSIGVANSRIESYCKVVDKHFLSEVNKKKPDNWDDFYNIWYESQGCNYGTYNHYNNSRYHMLNFHATHTKGTIEFRLFQFDNYTPGHKGAGLHAGKLKAYIHLCLAMSNYAKSVNRASCKEPVANLENPKYAMRFWLNAMGLVGDEFKVTREWLMYKLEGNSDCRTGDRSQCNHRAA